ncbi:MAG TPA: ATP-dependent helicase, partial [Candidatus Blautia merdavium]|nr:ATP-dependent helicase [Candidatus Blautia merdavium]
PLEAKDGTCEEEEERRLFFVGITRAKEELVITWRKEPSRFLEEITSQDTLAEKAGKRREAAPAAQLSLFDFL